MNGSLAAAELTLEKGGGESTESGQHRGSGGRPAASQGLGTQPAQEVRRQLDDTQKEEIPELIPAYVGHIVDETVVEEVVACAVDETL